ncbi:copia protein [Tanacetum coccineum]
MSNTNNNLQTQTSNALHNAIMEAGGKDHPPMLVPGNFVYWKSRIKRYIDTKPNNELIHYCLQNLPYKFKWTKKTVPVAEGIDNDIYSTVDACPNACEMWKAIERLKQGKSINVQDLETNLYWEFGKFTSRDGESLESYYSRFYKMMNELVRNQCDITNHQVNVQFLLQLQPEWKRFVTLVKQSQELKTVSYHKLYDILKQHQNEVNEIRAERLARTANPLALVAQQQPVYHPQNHPNHYTLNSSTRSQPSATRNREVTPDAADNSRTIFDAEPLQKVQNDDDNYNVFDNDKEHHEQPESVNEPYLVEQDEHNIIIDSLDMSYDREQDDQDDTDDLAKERDLLASLIEKLKCEIDDIKNHNKFLESSNKALVDKLKSEIEDFKTKNKSLESSNNHFKKANNELSKTNQLMFKDLKKFQAELDRYHDVNCASKVEIDCAKAKGDLMSYENELFAHQETISIMSQEKEDQTKFHKTRDDKELEKIIALENKIKVLDDIVYKTGQSVQTMNILNRNYKTSFVKPEFLKKSQRANPRLYDIEEMVADLRYFNSVEHEVDSLKSQLETQKTQFLNEIDRLSREYYNADHMNAILGGYTTLDKFTDLQCDYVDQVVKCVRLKKSFQKILPQNMKLILKNTNVIAPGMYKVHTKPNQSRTPQLPQDIRKSNKCVSFSIGVIPTTSVSRPQLKSNRMKDSVMPNNSQGKKQEVEDHRRNFKFSNNKMFVTACNDSLNAKTLNVNFVCVTCGKCMLNDNHDICVLHYINGVNSRTRQPIAVPISTREPKRNLIEIILFIIDSGCSKHMTGNLKLLIAFQKSTCYIRDLKGNDLLTSSHGTDLYSITLQETSTPNPICLMAKATPSQAWLWHHHLSHLNFDTINLLSNNDIVTGLPKLKFVKYHLCSSYELGKAKRESFHTKTTPSSKRRLQLLHMDLCGPMRVESINGNKYVLVIIDDYSRYTWTHFLRSNDEILDVLIDFLRLVQRGLHAQAEAIATSCFTQNRLLVIPRHEKTPYHIISGRKLSVKFFYIFGSLCYIVKDGENLDKMKEKGDACIFVGYFTQLRAYRVYNKRTKVIVETIHVNFNELPQKVTGHVSSDPVLQCLTTVLEQDNLSPGPQSQENVPLAAETVTTSNELDLLFSPMFNELLNRTTPVVLKSSTVTATDAPNQRQQQHTTPSTSTIVAADTPPLNIQTTLETTSQEPTQAPAVTANENIIKAKTNKEYAQVN